MIQMNLSENEACQIQDALNRVLNTYVDAILGVKEEIEAIGILEDLERQLDAEIAKAD